MLMKKPKPVNRERLEKLLEPKMPGFGRKVASGLTPEQARQALAYQLRAQRRNLRQVRQFEAGKRKPGAAASNQP